MFSVAVAAVVCLTFINIGFCCCLLINNSDFKSQIKALTCENAKLKDKLYDELEHVSTCPSCKAKYAKIVALFAELPFQGYDII